MNTLVILLDGAADEKIPAFGGKTPLEYLDKKFIDNIASNGDFGWTEGKDYTHLFLLEFLAGRSLNVPRGLVEAVGMGVPIEADQVAYRFSPVRMSNGSVEWLYRVSREDKARLQKHMVSNLDLLEGMDPRLYFFEDGRGVMTVHSPTVVGFPSPPAPLPSRGIELGDFDQFIRKLAEELDGMTILPWGGGSINLVGNPKPLPSARSLVMVSNNPSMLGVGGVLGIRREQVDTVWSGFDESFRLLSSSNVFMHVEETDEISHRLDPEGKVALLKQVDDVLMENIDHLIGHKVAFVIDHGTSSISGQHIRMKVPFAISKVVEPGEAQIRFCENSGNYRPLSGLLDHFLNL